MTRLCISEEDLGQSLVLIDTSSPLGSWITKSFVTYDSVIDEGHGESYLVRIRKSSINQVDHQYLLTII